MDAAAQLADPERAALEALDRGDRETAINILMRAYGSALYGFCRQMVHEPDLAEEVHQMTFVQAYESLGRFARRSALRTWLYGIARHRCLDALKITRRRRARFKLVKELPDEAQDETGIEDRLAKRTLADALEDCLDKLAPQIREAVLLRYREDVSYPEMARISHERPATLQARVARALPVLRRCIESQGLQL